MAKITIVIEDRPAGDPGGNINCSVLSDPPLTEAQAKNRETLTVAQRIGDNVCALLNRMLTPPPVVAGEVVELKEEGK